MLQKNSIKVDLVLFIITLSFCYVGTAVHSLPEYYTTDDLLNEIVPTVKSIDPEDVKRSKYKPELGDIIFREGIHEMGKYYTWFFNEDYTHSAIVTQIYPDVILSDCTKENMHSGVGDTNFHTWALKARKIEVLRVKDMTPEKFAKLQEFIQQAKIDGVLFDRTWDKTLADLSETNKKRRMYCTVFIRDAFKHAGVDLVPKPYREYIPVRQLLLIIAGVRSNHWTFITINNLRSSPLLDEVTKFSIKPVTIRENIRVRSNINGDMDDVIIPPERELMENPDPREMVMSYKGETIVLQPNPLHEMRYRNVPDFMKPPNPFKNLEVRQKIIDFGHGIDSMQGDDEHNSNFEKFAEPAPAEKETETKSGDK